MEWKQKNGKKIKVKNMTNEHIINCIKMLRRNDFIDPEIVNVYLKCTPPSSDAAQDCFDREFEFVLSKIPCKWITIFKKELKQRGVSYEN
jgi:hypothetical protein